MLHQRASVLQQRVPVADSQKRAGAGKGGGLQICGCRCVQCAAPGVVLGGGGGGGGEMSVTCTHGLFHRLQRSLPLIKQAWQTQGTWLQALHTSAEAPQSWRAAHAATCLSAQVLLWGRGSATLSWPCKHASPGRADEGVGLQAYSQLQQAARADDPRVRQRWAKLLLRAGGPSQAARRVRAAPSGQRGHAEGPGAAAQAWLALRRRCAAKP